MGNLKTGRVCAACNGAEFYWVGEGRNRRTLVRPVEERLCKSDGIGQKLTLCVDPKDCRTRYEANGN